MSSPPTYTSPVTPGLQGGRGSENDDGRLRLSAKHQPWVIGGAAGALLGALVTLIVHGGGGSKAAAVPDNSCRRPDVATAPQIGGRGTGAPIVVSANHIVQANEIAFVTPSAADKGWFNVCVVVTLTDSTLDAQGNVINHKIDPAATPVTIYDVSVKRPNVTANVETQVCPQALTTANKNEVPCAIYFKSELTSGDSVDVVATAVENGAPIRAIHAPLTLP